MQKGIGGPRQRERRGPASTEAPFQRVLARRDAESLRAAPAVTSFLQSVYNVLSTRVASLLAFRCIINEQVSPAPWLTPLAPSFLRVKGVCACYSFGWQPLFLTADPADPSSSSRLVTVREQATRRCLSFVHFLSGRGAHNEMREEDGDTSFGRSVERRATLTKGNTICTPSREALFPALFRTHARPPAQCTPVAVAVRNDARFSWKFVCRSLSDARFRHFAFDYPDFRLDRLRRKID